MDRSRRIWWSIGIAALTLTMGAGAVRAATLTQLLFPTHTTAGSTCSASLIQVQFDGTTNQNDDGNHHDWVAAVTYDGAGTAVGYLKWGIPSPATPVSGSGDAYRGTNPIGSDYHIADIAFAPVKLVLYDLTAAPSGTVLQEIAQAEASPVLGQTSFDPRTDGNLSTVCAALPDPFVISALSPWGLMALIALLAGAALTLLGGQRFFG